MWFAKNKIRKRNLYFRNIMALSVPHMWKKAYSLYVFVWLSLNQGMLFWLAADRGGAMLVLSGTFLLLVERKPGLYLSPPSPLPFNIHTKLSLSHSHGHQVDTWSRALLSLSPPILFPRRKPPYPNTSSDTTQRFFNSYLALTSDALKNRKWLVLKLDKVKTENERQQEE